MEGANVSADQMLTLFEALGNDSSKLIPLFSNNSKELLTLKKRFNDVNDSLQITGTQAAALRDVSDTFTLMTSSIGNATTAISATLAPVLDDFFNDIIDIVPDATQAIVNFINTFLDAENITSVISLEKEIAELQESTEQRKEKIENSGLGRMKKSFELQQAREVERLESLEKQLELIKEQQRVIDDASRDGGGEIGGEKGAGLTKSENGLGTGDEIAAIEDRFKTEVELLQQKLDMELEIIGDNDELKLNLFKEFEDNKNKIAEKASKKN